MSKHPHAKPKDRLETEPPKRAKCPRCGSRVLRFSYSTLYREHGFRRVTCHCQGCQAIVWWDEEWEGPSPPPP